MTKCYCSSLGNPQEIPYLSNIIIFVFLAHFPSGHYMAFSITLSVKVLQVKGKLAGSSWETNEFSVMVTYRCSDIMGEFLGDITCC